LELYNSNTWTTLYLYLVSFINNFIYRNFWAKSLQNTLSADNITSTDITRNPALTGIANGNSKRLKRTLRTVVVIVTISATNMQCNARRLRKALQAVSDHLSAQVTDLLAPEAQVNNSPRPAREINHCP
jgi:hypothetical protein